MIGPVDDSSSARRRAANPDAARCQAAAYVYRYHDSYTRLGFTPISPVTFRQQQTPYHKAEVLTVGPPSFLRNLSCLPMHQRNGLTFLSLPHA